MSTTTFDHDEIRKWAESKGGKPAAVDRTHHDGDVGIVRLMFPDSKQSEHQALVEISWDEFFEQFDENNLALIYDEKSLFNKIIGRDTAEKREHGEHASRHHPGSGGNHQAGGRSTKPASNENESKARGSSGTSSAKDSKDQSDLKSREYTDAEGNVHHHTRAYEQQQSRK